MGPNGNVGPNLGLRIGSNIPKCPSGSKFGSKFEAFLASVSGQKGLFGVNLGSQMQ